MTHSKEVLKPDDLLTDDNAEALKTLLKKHGLKVKNRRPKETKQE